MVSAAENAWPGKPVPVSARTAYRILLSFLTLLLLFAAGFFGALGIVSYGPSPAARDLFVLSVMETSAAKFLAGLYFSEEEIRGILERHSVKEPEGVSDVSLIHVPEREAGALREEIVIEEIRGSTYKAKMMIVRDPSRLIVGTARDAFAEGLRGRTVDGIIARYEGVGGINAGGFADEQGKGDGSVPLGLVISEGVIRWGSPGGSYEVIGMDGDNKLVVGRMTGRQALERGVRDAVSFGPLLIINGEALETRGAGSGLNPRTAIGQREDGTVLLLTVDGRQVNSLGATMGDVVGLMLDYGAVNAANLDGGSSTAMYYEGELINVCCSLYGPRSMPTAFVVK